MNSGLVGGAGVHSLMSCATQDGMANINQLILNLYLSGLVNIYTYH